MDKREENKNNKIKLNKYNLDLKKSNLLSKITHNTKVSLFRIDSGFLSF